MGITNIVYFYFVYWRTEPLFIGDTKSIFPDKENKQLSSIYYNSLLLRITEYNLLSLKNEMSKLWEN